MNPRIIWFLAIGASLACAKSPELAGTIGVGAGWAAQHYNGSYGKNTEYGQNTEYLYGRAFVETHPLEWLGLRVIAGKGDVANRNFETDWLSHAGASIVLQPRIEGFGPVRPYLASGVASMFGSAMIDGVIVKDLDWNWYAPLELGIEYLVHKNISIWAFGETYLHSEEWDKLDGIRTGNKYYYQRDALMKAGAGLTFRFSVFTDTDKDGIRDGLDRCPGTSKGVKIDAGGCPLDGDADGVADDLDLCAASVAGIQVNAQGCPVDTDLDGVADYTDKCGQSPAGVAVNAEGCSLDVDGDGVADYQDKCNMTPTGVMVTVEGCPVDGDADGIADYQDKCANTPMGAQVTKDGCPMDTDGDGVADYMDRCANTPRATKVEADGCPVIVLAKGTTLIMQGIVFKTGSAEIDTVSAPRLRWAAESILKSPKAKIEIAGFTDTVGLDERNRVLSLERAESVKAYLVRLAVPAKRLTTKGYGPDNPVAENATEIGRSQNRRIEFRVK